MTSSATSSRRRHQDRAGLRGVHQEHTATDLGRHHPAGVESAIRLCRAQRVRSAARRAFRSTPSDAMRVAGDQMGFPTPDVILDGEVIESDPPRKLVQTWRLLMDPACAAEPFSTLTYEIGAADRNGVCRLTVSHDLSGAPATATLVAGNLEETGAGGGWNWVLDDLKTLLETGHAFGE